MLAATRKTATARLLAMLCVLAVFVPSFFMVGAGRQLFVPLSLAVGFAMVSSYVLSSTLVPVLSAWWMREGHEAKFGERLRDSYGRNLDRLHRFRWPIVGPTLLGCAAILVLLLPRLGTEVFPPSNGRPVSMRLRAADGNADRARPKLIELEGARRHHSGGRARTTSRSARRSSACSRPAIRSTPSTCGPAVRRKPVMLFAVQAGTRAAMATRLTEQLRARLHDDLPESTVSFEAGDIISQVMSFGSPTPMEVAVQGPSLAANRAYRGKGPDSAGDALPNCAICSTRSPWTTRR